MEKYTKIVELRQVFVSILLAVSAFTYQALEEKLKMQLGWVFLAAIVTTITYVFILYTRNGKQFWTYTLSSLSAAIFISAPIAALALAYTLNSTLFWVYYIVNTTMLTMILLPPNIREECIDTIRFYKRRVFG